MKKVLMVGAGIGQLFLARKIKEKGHYLIAVTLPGNQPVIDIADKVCYENVFNKEGVLRIAQEEKVDAVISDQNDMMMPTVAYVAERLGLPGNNTSQVNAFCNKNVFRTNCDRLGIPVPKHCSVTAVEVPKEFVGIPFPWMVKPADAQSSVGVAKVNNEEEYLEAISKALEISKTNSAILEEFFVGQEMVCEGFVYKGVYYNLGFADRKYFALNNLFIPSQTIFPSVAPKAVLDAIRKCEKKMASEIKSSFAIIHSEYLYNLETNEIRVVESALRGGGVYISSHLIPLYSGIDINDTLISAMLGEEVKMDEVLAVRNEKSAAYLCFYLPVGEILSVSGFEDVKAMDCVEMCDVHDVVVGERTLQLTHKGQRLGPIIVKAENRIHIEEIIENIQHTIKVEVKGDDGIVRGVIWE